MTIQSLLKRKTLSWDNVEKVSQLVYLVGKQEFSTSIKNKF